MSANPSTLNAHNEIITRFRNNLPAGFTLDECKFVGFPLKNTNTDKWLRLTIIDQVNNNVAAGGTWQRKEGLIQIDIYTKKSAYNTYQYTDMLTDAESLQTTFQNVRFNGVNCEEATISGPFEEDDVYIKVMIQIDFYYEGTS